MTSIISKLAIAAVFFTTLVAGASSASAAPRRDDRQNELPNSISCSTGGSNGAGSLALVGVAAAVALGARRRKAR